MVEESLGSQPARGGSAWWWCGGSISRVLTHVTWATARMETHELILAEECMVFFSKYITGETLTKKRGHCDAERGVTIMVGGVIRKARANGIAMNRIKDMVSIIKSRPGHVLERRGRSSKIVVVWDISDGRDCRGG